MIDPLSLDIKMSSNGPISALHLLDDYLESVETLPSEIQQQLQLLKEKDAQVEELQKNLFKKRSVLLKATDKSIDESMQSSLRKRAEKDASRAAALLDEKMQIQLNLLQIVEQHMQRLEKEVYRPLSLPFDDIYSSTDGPFEDIPDAQVPAPTSSTGRAAPSQSTHFPISNSQLVADSALDSLKTSISSGEITKISRPTSPRAPLLTISASAVINEATASSSSQKVSPRKRLSLTDEPPTDPNEPVYCYCQQVSWGEMIACDSQTCAREWFHYACAGLSAPPKGKWYCNECKSHLEGNK